jgi:acylaminoacyl-peptidase
LLINFRGSTNYGQNFLESLPGNIGIFDAQDVMQAFRKATDTFHYLLSMDNAVITGGSHGGYLTTLLIGLYPDAFKRAATRNPVTNIAHNYAITDIPDWCIIEAGISKHYDSTYIATPEDYQKMYRISPIWLADKVKTPLLLMLGDADRRVPMSQGIDFFKVIKARGVQTRCLVYPGNQHALNDSVATEGDVWVNTALWLGSD